MGSDTSGLQIEIAEVVVDEYSLDEFTRVKIVKLPDGSMEYRVIQPELNDKEKLVVEDVRRWFIEELSVEDLESEKVKLLLDKVVRRFAKKRLGKKVSDDVVKKISYVVMRDLLGFGKLDPLLKDPNIEDIHVVGIGRPVFVWHRLYENLPTNIFFFDPEELNRHLHKIMLTSGKFASLSRPIVDGTLPMGYRVHVVHPVISELGAAITIRKYREVPFTVADLMKFGTVYPELLALLWVAMEHKRSVFIVGETAAGKTTLLNALATLIPVSMKVVVIEEVREIKLPHPNVIYMVTKEGVEGVGKVTLFDLVKASMRQRPDFIIVGEVRGEEAYVLMQAISLGHGGLSTMHAEGAVAAVKRLMAPPMNIPPYLVKLLDIVIHITKVRGRAGIKRYVLSASEITDIDLKTGEPSLNVIYKVNVDIDDPKGPKATLATFRPEESLTLKKISDIKGIPLERLLVSVKKRADFLRKLVAKNPTYDEVINAIMTYKEV